MSVARLEEALARLYVDADARATYLVDPEAYARAQPLDDAGRRALCALDRDQLAFAAASYEKKRTRRATARRRRSWFARLLDRI